MADPSQSLTFDSFMAQQATPPPKTGEENFDTFMQKAKYFGVEFPEEKPKQPGLFEDAAREMARGGLAAPAPAGQAPKPEMNERGLTATLGQMAKDQAQGLYHAATTPLPQQFHQLLGTGEQAPTMRELYDKSMPALVDKAKSAIDSAFGVGTVDRLPRDFPWLEFAGNLANEAAGAGMSILDFGTTPAGMALPEATTIPMALRPAVGAGIATSMVPGTVEAVKEAVAKPSSETIPKAIVQTAVNALPIAATVPFLRTTKEVFDEKIAQHNAQAAQLVEQERTAGRQLDIAQEVHGEPVPVEISGKPHTIELAGVNEKTGRPIFQVVNQETGKPVFMGYGPNTQDFLRSKEALPEKPAASTEAAAPAAEQQTPQAQTPTVPGLEPTHPEAIKVGQVFEGDSGKYTVNDIQNGKVKFTAETKAGNVSGTMKLESFQKRMQDQGLLPPTQAPEPIKDEGLVPPSTAGGPAGVGPSQIPANTANTAPVVQPPQAAPEGAEKQAELRNMPDSMIAEELRRPEAERRYDYNALLGEATARGITLSGQKPAATFDAFMEQQKPQAQTPPPAVAEPTHPEVSNVVTQQQDPRNQLLASLSAKQPENLPMPSEPAKGAKTGSVEDLVRGSADVHLSPAGHEQADERGKQLVQNLGFGQPGDILVTGDLTRAKQTGAHILQHAPDVHVLPANQELDTWGLGGAIEGKPTNDKAIKQQIRDLVEKHPDQVPEQGEGGVSTRPAESFNQFKSGFLQGGLQPLMRAYEEAPADAKPMVVAVIHGRGVRVAKGWEAKGTPADNSIDNSFMLDDSDKPGEVYRFAPDKQGKWKLSEVDPAKPQARQPGILLMRHAETPWNKSDTATRGRGDTAQAAEAEPEGKPAETLQYRDSKQRHDKIDLRIFHEPQGWKVEADWNLQGQAGGDLGSSGYDRLHPTRDEAIDAFLRSAIRKGHGPQMYLDDKSTPDPLRRRAANMLAWLSSPKTYGRTAPQEHQINPESRYAGDAEAADALVDQTKRDQGARFNIIRTIEKGLEGNRWPQPKKQKQMREELAALKHLYDATWSELSDAVGEKAARLAQQNIEGKPQAQTTPLPGQATSHPEVRGVPEPTTQQPHDYSSTQINLPPNISTALIAYGAAIPDENIGKEGRETEPHIIVKYGLHTSDPEKLRKLLEDEPPITATLGKTSVFADTKTENDGKEDVLKVSVESPDLHRLNKKISDALPHTDTYPDYKPHATIAYLKNGAGKQYAGQEIPGVTGQQFTLNSITFSGKDGNKVEIPLSGKMAGTPETGLAERGFLILEAEGLPGRKVPVTDAEQASKILSAYRDQNNLGGSQFTERTGNLVTASGKVIARVGYNGRVWAPDGTLLWEPKGMTLPMEPGQRVTAAAFETGQQPEPAPATFDAFMEQQKPQAQTPTAPGQITTVPEAKEVRIEFTWGGGGYLVENKSADRIQAFFKSKPPEAVRSSLKHNGFKWAPSQGAWQRQLTPNARATAARLFNVNLNAKVEQPAPVVVPLEPGRASVADIKLGDVVTFDSAKERGYVGQGNITAILKSGLEIRIDPYTTKTRKAGMDIIDPAQVRTINNVPVTKPEPEQAQTTPRPGQASTHPEASNIGGIQENKPSQIPQKESIIEPHAEPVPTRSTPEAVAANEPEVSPGTSEVREPERNIEPSSEPGTGRVRPSDREGAESRPSEGTRPRGTGTTAGAELRGESSDYRITDADRIGEGGLKQKANDNLAAIRVLKQIEAEGRVASPEEQKALVKYVGWGQMPQPFAPYVRPEWQGFSEELKQLLTPEEFQSASASTPNAHYTSPMVVKGMWDALEHLGITPEQTSLSVLEPAMGVGHFYGLMPPDLADISHRAGVELDKVSGRISKLLYPKADVHIAGFEQVRLPDSFFDLAVSNVPFGNYPVHDPAYKRNPLATRSIHDYFFAKALDKVRPGGIVAFITSSFTMDKRDGAMRKYLSDRADLLGAIRLPNTAFKGNAGTEVTTDIIFLQKRAPQTPPKGEPWTELGQSHPAAYRTNPFPINEYYARHPEMMLGKMALEGTMYGPEKSAALIGDLTPEALKAAISNLPADAFREWESPAPQFTASSPEISAPRNLKEGAYIVETTSPGGKVHHTVMRNEGGRLRPAEIPAAEAARVMGMVEIRDAMRKVFDTQFHDAPEKEVTAARNHLNKVYDFFVRKNGYLSTAANVRAFKDDPDSPSLLALEEWNSDEKKAKKAAIFSQRTIDKYRPADKADSATDALSISLNERGKIDWARMQELTGRTPDEMRSELGPLVYQNPAGKHWETADEYLSGNVRKKLADAQAAGKSYARNVEALKAVQPTDLHPEEIEARLGASWIPKEDVRQFVSELLELPLRSVRIGHSDALASWTVDLDNKQGVANVKTYGTDRYYAHELIQDALNLRNPTVYDTVGSGADARTVINEQQTLAARGIQEQIKDRFKEWAWENPERSQRLAKGYNEEFNSDRLWQPEGAHLSMPGMSAAIKLKPHQKNVIWRALRGSNVLLAHVVGAGKTFEMIGIAKESRRLGLAKKPMMVVPKNRVEETGAEFLRMYPAANILVMSSEDFTPQNRQKLMGRIATGNWDSVIVSYESFEKLPVSDETFNEYLRDQIEDLTNYILEAKADKSDAKIVKELEKSKKRLEAKLRGKADQESKDTGLTFEELGVDQLLVDEADNFKNLFFPTKMTRVAGIPNTESKRAFDMYIKTQHVAKRNGGRGIIFATGTPIANTMAEMYTMQRYLQPEWLRDHGLQHFDAWAQTFGQVVPTLEVSPDASGFRMTNRFAKFVNIPELSQGFRNVADVQTGDMLKLPVPKVRGGGAQTHSAPASDDQKAYLQELAKRAEAIRGKNGPKVDPRKDNMLKVSTDGRKAALDMRLVQPGAADHPGSKLNLAVSTIYDVWKQGQKDRTTQLVFVDFSSPRKKGEANKFTVPDDMKEKLVAKGIPANEIAFAQSADTDAKKEKLYQDVNAGKIRVLFGSTPTLGVGVNVQKRLIAAHHLDAPWRPRDIEQREGRIIRQGNTNAEVQIHTYVTEPSFDAKMWNTLQTKATFIGQVMKGDTSVRSAEDISETALSYAEVSAIASGNPAIREKTLIDAEVRKLDSLRTRHKQQQEAVKRDLQSLPQTIEAAKSQLAKIESDIATRDAEPFQVTVGKQKFTKKDARKDAAEAIQKALQPYKGDDNVIFKYGEEAKLPTIGTYRGLNIKPYYAHSSDIYNEVIGTDGRRTFLRKSADGMPLPDIRLEGNFSYNASTNQERNPDGTMRSIEAAITRMDKDAERARDTIATNEKKLADTKELAGKPFAQDAKLKDLLAKQAALAKQLQTAAPDPQAMGAELANDHPEDLEDLQAIKEGAQFKRPVPTVGAPAEAKEGAPISEYQAGTGRLPTPIISGHGVKGWLHGELEGRPLYSNGHILLEGEAPGPKLAEPRAGIDKAMTPATTPAPIHPAAFSKETKDTPGLVWFDNGTAVDSKYYDHALKRYPDATFSIAKQTATGTQQAVYLDSKGKRVGVIMPVRAEPSPTIAQILEQFVTSESGESNLPINIATLGTAKLIQEDLKPALKSAVHTLRGAKDDIQRLLAPASRKGAKPGALVLRESGAELARRTDIAMKALEGAQKYFAKRSPDENYDFIDKIENGEKQNTPEEDFIAQMFRDILDERRDEVQALGTGKLQNFNENYFPHIWEKPDQAADWVKQWYGKRPLEGGKAFLKRRKIPTIKEGLEAGLTPVSDNPVDLVLAKTREMDKYILAHQALDSLKEGGMLKYVPVSKRPEDGWALINDPVATVWGPRHGAVKLPEEANIAPEEVGVIGQRIMGHYYAPEPVATLVNNYLSPGLRDKSGLFRAYLGLGNMLNQFQLGFSAFHLAFTALDSATSKFALGVYQTAHGHPLKGLGSIAQTPFAPFTGMLKGSKMLKEWNEPGTQGVEIGQMVDAMVKAGGRAKMDAFYRTKVTDKMLATLRRGNVLGAALRVPFALVEQAARPVLDYAVPRMKMAVFADLARFELQRLGPDATTKDAQAALARAWDSVDNRMGQLVYDNLFWTKTLKDLAMGSIRSVGWNTGTIREIGGAMADVLGEGRKLLGGEPPDLTPRMSYAIALPIVVGLLGALLTYLWTGKGPEKLIDYYYPKDQDSRRWSLPSYIKDIHAYATDPGRTLRNKIHPLLTLIGEMLSNRDYYDKPIMNPHHPAVKQAQEALKHIEKSFSPIPFRQFTEPRPGQGKTFSDRALPFVGVTPAPKSVQHPWAKQQSEERRQRYY